MQEFIALLNHLHVAKTYVDNVLFVDENKHEIDKQCKQVWMGRMFPGNAKHTHSTKYCKIYLTSMHLKILI